MSTDKKQSFEQRAMQMAEVSKQLKDAAEVVFREAEQMLSASARFAKRKNANEEKRG